MYFVSLVSSSSIVLVQQTTFHKIVRRHDFIGGQGLRIAWISPPSFKAIKNLAQFCQGLWIVCCIILDKILGAYVLPAIPDSLIQTTADCLQFSFLEPWIKWLLHRKKLPSDHSSLAELEGMLLKTYNDSDSASKPFDVSSVAINSGFWGTECCLSNAPCD